MVSLLLTPSISYTFFLLSLSEQYTHFYPFLPPEFDRNRQSRAVRLFPFEGGKFDADRFLMCLYFQSFAADYPDGFHLSCKNWLLVMQQTVVENDFFKGAYELLASHTVAAQAVQLFYNTLWQ